MKPKGCHSLTMEISEQYKHKQRKTPYRLKVYDHYIKFGIYNQQPTPGTTPDNSTPLLPHVHRSTHQYTSFTPQTNP